MTRLGQHFLISKKVACRIVEVANVTKNDIVLEIGPGKGMLTEELLKRANRVIAVEKDQRFCKFLEEKFFSKDGSAAGKKPFTNLTLICDDIRDILSSKGIPWINIPRDALGNKVVANIPYYLTGQILRQLLPQSANWRIEVIVLMVQKEVAERIVAKNKGKMSLLAISVQVFAEPKIAFYVSKKHFRPQPKVDSAVIILKKRPKDLFKENAIQQEDFFKLVKAGFSHKRKLLINNIKKMLDVDCLTRCKIAEKARSENLSLEDWACLTKQLKS